MTAANSLAGPMMPTASDRLDIPDDDLADALEAAAGYSRQYYGERSPIMVHQGRKHIVTIPRRNAA